VSFVCVWVRSGISVCESSKDVSTAVCRGPKRRDLYVNLRQWDMPA
jgi:hypothetical protein